MKNFLSLIICFGAFNVSAAKFKATIDDVFCAEIDPFVVGDACIVSMTKTNNDKLALVVDVDEYYQDYYDSDIKEGDVVTVDDSSLGKIFERTVIGVLQNVVNKNYYYMYARPLKMKVLDEVSSSAAEIEALLALSARNIRIYKLPEGYTTKTIKTPKLKRNLIQKLEKMSAQKKYKWYEYVFASGEYDHLSKAERVYIARNPKRELAVKYLLEISEVREIYNNGRFIGYYMEVLDHVQAAEYQDGAWYEMFLDIDQNIMKYFAESA